MVDFSDLEELDDSHIRWIEDHLVPNVERGAELLDQNIPGWAKIINTRHLDLSVAHPTPLNNYDGCILCQIDNYIEESRVPTKPLDYRNFGNFTEAWDKIRDNDWVEVGELTASDFGFDCYTAGTSATAYIPPAVDDVEYQILDKLWLAEIEKRVG